MKERASLLKIYNFLSYYAELSLSLTKIYGSRYFDEKNVYSYICIFAKQK